MSHIFDSLSLSLSHTHTQKMVDFRVLYLFPSALILLNAQEVNGGLPAKTQPMIAEANRNGPYLGLVIPNLFEMNPLLQSPSFTSSNFIIDIAGNNG